MTVKTVDSLRTNKCIPLLMLSVTHYVHLLMLKSFNIYELDYKHIHFVAVHFQREPDTRFWLAVIFDWFCRIASGVDTQIACRWNLVVSHVVMTRVKPRSHHQGFFRCMSLDSVDACGCSYCCRSNVIGRLRVWTYTILPKVLALPSLEQKNALPNLWQQRWEHNSCI